MGSIYSWSLTNVKGIEGNEKALGFPMNQYLTFFVLTLIAIGNAVCASFLPDNLNYQLPANDDDIEKALKPISKQTKRTDVTVSFFTPEA